MRYVNYILVILLIIPIISYSQLKKDADNSKINISNVLNSSLINQTYRGLLDPSRLQISHSVSMSYLSFGGYSAMINTYLNTMNYKFSEKLLLTTKLGIMNSPYNSLPNNSYLNDSHIFGGAQLKYTPSENSVIYLSVESAPYLYSGESLFYQRNPFSISNH